MIVIIFWLLGTFISCLIFYTVVKMAINHSDIMQMGGETRTLSHQLNRQHQDMMKQIEEMKQLLAEQNDMARVKKYPLNKE